MIFAANSRPVAFWMHLRTTEKAPLKNKIPPDSLQEHNAGLNSAHAAHQRLQQHDLACHVFKTQARSLTGL